MGGTWNSGQAIGSGVKNLATGGEALPARPSGSENSRTVVPDRAERRENYLNKGPSTMSENPQQAPQQAEIILKEEHAHAAYSNFARVTSTAEEVIIDFCLNPNPFATGRQEIIVSQRLIIGEALAIGQASGIPYERGLAMLRHMPAVLDLPDVTFDPADAGPAQGGHRNLFEQILPPAGRLVDELELDAPLTRLLAAGCEAYAREGSPAAATAR